MAKRRVSIPNEEMPDPEQARKDLEQFGRDMEYLAAHYDQLQAEHPDWWVAIYRGRVVAITETPEELVAAMDVAGAPRAHTLVEHLNTNPIIPTHMVM